MNKKKETKEEKAEEYQGGGAYRAMLSLFADHISDEEYAEHCRKFFKGDNDDTRSNR